MDLDDFELEMKDALRRDVESCEKHPEMISCAIAVGQIELRGRLYEIQVKLQQDKDHFISLTRRY